MLQKHKKNYKSRLYPGQILCYFAALSQIHRITKQHLSLDTKHLALSQSQISLKNQPSQNSFKKYFYCRAKAKSYS